MPWWALLYMILCLVVSIASDAIGMHKERRTWWWVLDSVHGLVFVTLFASYWVIAIQRFLGGVAPLLFMVALAWELYSAPSDFREIWSDTELSTTERISLIVAGIALFLPLYVVAGIAAFRQTG